MFDQSGFLHFLVFAHKPTPLENWRPAAQKSSPILQFKRQLFTCLETQVNSRMFFHLVHVCAPTPNQSNAKNEQRILKRELDRKDSKIQRSKIHSLFYRLTD